MNQYTVCPKDDFLLFRWWQRMLNDEDLFKVFTRSMGALSIFFMSWRKPMALYYEQDEAGITMAAWVEPGVLDAGAYGLWVRPDKRHSKSSLQFVLATIEIGIERFPALITMTRDELMNQQFKKFGFINTIVVPKIFDGDDAHVSIMTRESFAATAHRPAVAQEGIA